MESLFILVPLALVLAVIIGAAFLVVDHVRPI